MSQDSVWIRIAACENIPLREGRVTVVRGRQIAIFNVGDRFLAVENRCPHRGGPLAEGIVFGTTVVCPLHARKIDLQTGTVADPSNSLPCVAMFPTRVADGIVELQFCLNELEKEPLPDDVAPRDRPIRWVQRKSSAPISAPSEVL
jgi:nitrite reductase [NAD(P)H] small subunit